MKKLIYLYLFIFSTFVLGQNKSDFDYFYEKSFTNLYNDPDECIKFSQGLIINDKNDANKIAYQNVLSQSYALKGDFLSSIKTIIYKTDLNNSYKSNFQQNYLDFSLADQYQNLGLYEQSKVILDHFLDNNNFLSDEKNKPLLGKIYQLQAINFAVTKKYDIALNLLEKSNSYLINTSEEHTILNIENQLFKAIIYTNKKQLEKAISAFNIILNQKEIANYNFLHALARENASRAYFQNQETTKSINLLNEALSKIDSYDYKQLKGRIYDGLSDAYLSQKNETKYKYYRDLSNNTKTELDKNKKSAINLLVSELESIEKEQIQFQKQNLKFNSYLSLSFSVALLFILGGFFFYTSKTSRSLKKQIDFFEKIQSDNSIAQIKIDDTKTISEVVSEDQTSKKTNLLSEEKENELLAKLEIFENSELFLSNQMSLPFLAAEMDTNIKYLSEVIRKFKNKNFNSYINELRIQHLVKILKTNPVYLNYKVSYLAEISGFSSHSAFTAVFKSITGISPNDFIKKLSENQ